MLTAAMRGHEHLRGQMAARRRMRLGTVAAELARAGLSGGLLVLSFPPFDLGLLAWVGLVPLLLALEGKSPARAYGLSYATGLVFCAGSFSWIWSIRAVTVVDSVLLLAYIPQYVSLWGLALNLIRTRTGLPAPVVAPPLWVTFEYLRSNLSFLSLPWMLLGHSQYQHPSLLQLTTITGVYGLTFLIVLTNAAFAELLRYAGHRFWGLSVPTFRTAGLSLAAVGLLLGAALVYAQSVLSTPPGRERVAVALVQANVPQGQKWDRAYRQAILDRYTRLTQEAARGAPLLIAWPETAVPGDVEHHVELRQAVARLATATGSHLLVGSAEHAKFSDRRLHGKYYNSVVLFAPTGTMAGQYRKMLLVPFAEYDPAGGAIKWPTAVVATLGNTLPGREHTLFTVGDVPFAATICWENIFPDLVREFVRRGARFIVNATNEAWFDGTAFSHQILAINAFRAAENRVAIARVGNTGISAVIDPFGRIVRRLTDGHGKDLAVEGVLAGNLPLSGGMTFYTRHGEAFAVTQIALSALLLAACWAPVRATRRLQARSDATA